MTTTNLPARRTVTAVAIAAGRPTTAAKTAPRTRNSLLFYLALAVLIIATGTGIATILGYAAGDAP